MSETAQLVAIIVAALGSGAGIAAVLRSGADRSKTVAEGAGLVVEMLERRVADLEKRLVALERHLDTFEHWGDAVMDLLDRILARIDGPSREQFEAEAEAVKRTRPRRGGHS